MPDPAIIELVKEETTLTRGDNVPTPITIRVRDLVPTNLNAHIMTKTGNAVDAKVSVNIVSTHDGLKELRVTAKALVGAAAGERNVAVEEKTAIGVYYPKGGVTVL